MSPIMEAFVAVLFLAWPVPDGHPAAAYLVEPEETQLAVQYMGFASREDCEAFLALAQNDPPAGMLPYEGARVMGGECNEA
ncbi:hypothetical protein C2I36_05470 [Rhodobacteraceae bacterium WD3A24]|nr:hypothetical protein C2I36_05470 [Rhodobacteraceae bacterium WD3A24]